MHISLDAPVRYGRRRGRAAALRDAGKVHLVVGLVSASLGVPAADFYGASRGERRIAFARQVAMYITHVWMGLSLSAVGRGFGRDRTTVAHACRLIEDRRDDPHVDRMLDVMESAATELQSLADEQGGRGR